MNTKILQKYEDFVRGKYKNEQTIDVYISHPRVMLRHLNKQVSEITQKDIDNYIGYCEKIRKRNGNAIRFYSIRKFVEWLGREELFVKQVTRKNPEKVALDDSEISKLLETVEKLQPKHRMVFYLEFDAIRRPKEIRNLKIKDIYNGKIRYIGKTGQKIVTMTTRLEEAIKDYIENQRLSGVDKDEDKYLLIGDYGKSRGRHYKDNQAITRIIKEVCMYAQVIIPPRETASNYLIKRTTITYQLKLGSDPKLVQLQAGHENLSQTLEYDRISEKHLKNYVGLFQHNSEELKKKTALNQSKNI
jgi:integrase